MDAAGGGRSVRHHPGSLRRLAAAPPRPSRAPGRTVAPDAGSTQADAHADRAPRDAAPIAVDAKVARHVGGSAAVGRRGGGAVVVQTVGARASRTAPAVGRDRAGPHRRAVARDRRRLGAGRLQLPRLRRRTRLCQNIHGPRYDAGVPQGSGQTRRQVPQRRLRPDGTGRLRGGVLLQPAAIPRRLPRRQETRPRRRCRLEPLRDQGREGLPCPSRRDGSDGRTRPDPFPVAGGLALGCDRLLRADADGMAGEGDDAGRPPGDRPRGDSAAAESAAVSAYPDGRGLGERRPPRPSRRHRGSSRPSSPATSRHRGPHPLLSHPSPPSRPFSRRRNRPIRPSSRRPIPPIRRRRRPRPVGTCPDGPTR